MAQPPPRPGGLPPPAPSRVPRPPGGPLPPAPSRVPPRPGGPLPAWRQRCSSRQQRVPQAQRFVQWGSREKSAQVQPPGHASSEAVEQRGREVRSGTTYFGPSSSSRCRTGSVVGALELQAGQQAVRWPGMDAGSPGCRQQPCMPPRTSASRLTWPPWCWAAAPRPACNCGSEKRVKGAGAVQGAGASGSAKRRCAQAASAIPTSPVLAALVSGTGRHTPLLAAPTAAERPQAAAGRLPGGGAAVLQSRSGALLMQRPGAGRDDGACSRRGGGCPTARQHAA